MRFPWHKKNGTASQTINTLKLAIESARQTKRKEEYDKRLIKEAEWDKLVDPILQTVPELILASDGKNFYIKGLPQEDFYGISSSQVFYRSDTLVAHLTFRLKELGMESMGTCIDREQFALRVYI